MDGEPGIGKTTIWAEGVRRARSRGARVLVARPTEAERGLSFSGLADLFGTIPTSVTGRLPVPQQKSLAVALHRAPLPARGIDEAPLCAAVLSLLRLLAADSQIVLAIDDAQWLDPPTARAVEFASRRLDTERVRVFATRRATGATVPSFLADVDEARRRVVAVGPMTLAALRDLVAVRTGRTISRPTFLRIAEVCAGNPFYALEIVANLDEASDHDLVPVPASVSELVDARLGRLPAATRRALLVAAAVSHPTVDLVDRRALAAAEDAGVVSLDRQNVRFAHPLFASAIYNEAEPATRRRLHRRLVARVDNQEERARHLALSSTRADEAIASELVAAGLLAAARGAPDNAARMLELACDFTPSANADARAERRLTAARYWFDAGDLVRARTALVDMLDGASTPSHRAKALQLLGALHARNSTFVEAIGFAHEALREAGDDTELIASIELDLTYCSASMGDFDGARTHAQGALDAAGARVDSHLLADALGALTISEFMDGHGLDRERLERALALEDPASPGAFVLRPSYIHGCLLLWTGEPARALAVHDELLARTRERGEESAVPMLTLYLVWACVWLGDLRRAAQLAEESRDTAALLGDAAAEGIALAASALVHAHEGAGALATEEALGALAIFERLQWIPGTIWPLWALGLTNLTSGSPAAVDAALGPLAAFITSTNADVSLGVLLPDEVEALIELGEIERAEAVTSWLEARARALDRRWALALAYRCRALIQAAGRENERALESLTAAMTEHDRLDLPLERARTLLVLGRVLRRTGKRAQAKAALVEAWTTFDDAGARLWAQRTQDELDRLGTRTRDPDGLTPTEQRVADLAAQGLSNREIAERSFLTVKAVEANLTRVYRKLHIRSRVQLARILSDTQPAS